MRGTGALAGIFYWFPPETVKFRLGAQALMLMANVSSVRGIPGLLHWAASLFAFNPQPSPAPPLSDSKHGEIVLTRCAVKLVSRLPFSGFFILWQS
jgi:hypothetical protein